METFITISGLFFFVSHWYHSATLLILKQVMAAWFSGSQTRQKYVISDKIASEYQMLSLQSTRSHIQVQTGPTQQHSLE